MKVTEKKMSDEEPIQNSEATGSEGDQELDVSDDELSEVTDLESIGIRNAPTSRIGRSRRRTPKNRMNYQ